MPKVDINRVFNTYFQGKVLIYWNLKRYSDISHTNIKSDTNYLYEPTPFDFDVVEERQSSIDNVIFHDYKLKIQLFDETIFLVDYNQVLNINPSTTIMLFRMIINKHFF